MTSTLLAEEAGASLPGTQSLLAYTLLALVYPAALLVRTHLRRRRRRRDGGAVQADADGAPRSSAEGDAAVDDAENAPTVPPWLRRAWWQYAVVALIDVEANYVVVLAYQYTSITSIMLLDCFAIPVVMLLSRWRFAQRFSRIQLAGVALSLVGVALLVTSDVLNGRNDPNSTPPVPPCRRVRMQARNALGTRRLGGGAAAPNPALGDVLCLLGATMYAICNVWQEELVKKHGQLEFVALLSLFAVPISLVQSGALEGKLWATVNWSGEVIGLFIGFALCLFCVYSLVPVFLAVAGATPLNLSLLSSDFYALLFGIILFDFEVSEGGAGADEGEGARMKARARG